jgi:hypothetical protein
MVKFDIIFSVTLICCFTFPCHSDVSTIQSHSVVDLSRVNRETLVIYDVDETLIQPTDTYLVNEHTPEGKAFLAHFIKSQPKVNNWEELTSIILRDAHRPLIEPIVIYKIKQAKKLGAKVIALTSMNTGKVGFYERLEEWRYLHLKSIGFVGDFEDKVFNVSGFKRNPVFYKGILAADLEGKGDVLSSFLKIIELTPKYIIAIDDDKNALESIEKFCIDNHIIFKGYLYKGYKKTPWDSKLILFQAHYLIKKKEWLGDKAAKKMMNSTPIS